MKPVANNDEVRNTRRKIVIKKQVGGQKEGQTISLLSPEKDIVNKALGLLEEILGISGASCRRRRAFLPPLAGGS